jgi:hypothetical protein
VEGETGVSTDGVAEGDVELWGVQSESQDLWGQADTNAIVSARSDLSSYNLAVTPIILRDHSLFYLPRHDMLALVLTSLCTVPGLMGFKRHSLWSCDSSADAYCLEPPLNYIRTTRGRRYSTPLSQSNPRW